MERSKLIESIYDAKCKSDSEECTIKLDSMLYDLLLGKSTPEDAYLKLIKIDPNFKRHTFLDRIKEKPVYKSIQQYKNGTLSDIATAKMIASLITQVLIQYESDDNLTPKSLQISNLLEVLNQYSTTNQLNHELIDHILDNYGYAESIKEEELGSNE